MKEESSSRSSISFHLSFQLRAELRPIVPGRRFVSNHRNSNTNYVGQHAVSHIGSEPGEKKKWKQERVHGEVTPTLGRKEIASAEAGR